MKPPVKINFVSVAVNSIKLYKLVKKLIRQLRREGKMCFKKWFSKPDEVPLTSDKVLLTFGINDYPGGSGNDLNGCLHDQENMIKTLTKFWPEFQVRKFSDREATTTRYKAELSEALKQKWDTVLMFQDCCFSEDNTRKMENVRARFVAPKGEIPVIRKHFARSIDMRWLAFSACQDYQTAADALINYSYNGAFTWFACHTLRPEMTYRSWYEMTKSKLLESKFEQIPELQGPEELKNKKVFSDRTLVVHYSGHGTFTKDRNGDEADGQDEAMFLWDGLLLDDELSEILTSCL